MDATFSKASHRYICFFSSISCVLIETTIQSTMITTLGDGKSSIQRDPSNRRISHRDAAIDVLEKGELRY